MENLNEIENLELNQKKQLDELLMKFGYEVRIPDNYGKPKTYVKRYTGCYININNYNFHLNVTEHNDVFLSISKNKYRSVEFYQKMKSKLKIDVSMIGVTTVSGNFNTLSELEYFLMEFDKELARDIKINDLFNEPLF